MEQLLTLGVLVFNQSQFIGELVESIANQSEKNTQLVILDNGSTDDSFKEIQESLRRFSLLENATLIRNHDNTGSAEGIRTLLQLSQTKYLSVIHGDDILESSYVRIVLSKIKSGATFQALNVTLKSFSSDFLAHIPKTLYKPLWTSNLCLDRIQVCGLNPGVMPGSVLDRNYILDRRLLDFQGQVNGVEDTLLWMRIIRSGGTIHSISNPCYFYRIHKSQFSYSEDQNSKYFGFARRTIIDESLNLIERLLSSSEIAYEIKRFGIQSGYLEGLGPEYEKKYRVYSLFRIINILVRRFCLIIVAKRYR